MDAPPTPRPTTLRILTLNCWGLLGVSKHRASRFEAIGRALAGGGWDVVCLQEVWVAADAARLGAVAAAGGRLIHAHHFRAGAFGAGLVTLSAHPVVSARFSRFPAAGDPLALHQGDAVAGKGVGCVRVALPCGSLVDVFNTHLSAAYTDAHGRRAAARRGGGGGGAATTSGCAGGGASASAPSPCIPPRDFNGGIRLSQVVQVADFVRGCVPGAAAAVLAGDFNAPPTSLELALLAFLLPAGSMDAWAATRGNKGDNGDGEMMGGGGGFTANVPGGSYTTAGAGKRAARLDYLWAIGGATYPLSANVAMHLDPASGRSFSDHAGVECEVGVGGGGACTPGEATAAFLSGPSQGSPGGPETPAAALSTPGAWRGGGLFGSGRSGSGSRRRGGTPPAPAAPPPALHAPPPPPPPPPSSATPLAAAIPIIEATAAKMRVAADGAGAGAAVAAAVAAAALSILVSAAAAGSAGSPLPLAAAVPLLALLTAASLATPCLFIAGYVDRHAQAAALAAAAAEARLRLCGGKVEKKQHPKSAALAAPLPPPSVTQEQVQPLRVPAHSYA